MIKQKNKNHHGVTLIELMMAIAVIAIISSVFVFYIRGTDRERVERVTEQIAADARYIRNLATSRTTYDFGDGNPVFPPGGYGIEFVDFNNGSPAEYFVFADRAEDGIDLGGSPADYDEDKDGLIKHVVLDNADIRIDDAVGATAIFYFNFLEENKVQTNILSPGTADTYAVIVLDPGPGYPVNGYRGTVNLGERSAEISDSPTEYQYIWGTIGYYVSVYTPPAPPPPGPISKYDPVEWMPQGGGEGSPPGIH